MEEEKEVFKPIVGYSKYFVSNKGRVLSLWRHRVTQRRFLRDSNIKGYRTVCLISDEGARKMFLVHSLVANAFIGPKPIGMDVNHKDENKSNNAAENLEYLTRQDNLNYGMHNVRVAKSMSIGVTVYRDGHLVGSFESMKEAAERLSVNHSNLCGAANGKRKTISGFVVKKQKERQGK